MSTQDRDTQLMDYLYNEMDPSAQKDFEKMLNADDALAQVDDFQHMRTMLRNVEDEVAPGALMNDIMRQARLAVDDQPVKPR